jgi:hypothetical protein
MLSAATGEGDGGGARVSALCVSTAEQHQQLGWWGWLQQQVSWEGSEGCACRFSCIVWPARRLKLNVWKRWD